MAQDRKICVGQIAGAHGVRGLVRLRSFTDNPEDITAYGDLTDETGTAVFAITLKDVVKDHFTAQVKGIEDRDAAEELRGLKLYAARAKMPKTKKREYYAGDLIGLAARDDKGEELGKVMDIHNHGAGVFLEIGKTRRDSFMLPFTDACVPEVDVESGFVRVLVPEGWRETGDKPSERKAEK